VDPYSQSPSTRALSTIIANTLPLPFSITLALTFVLVPTHDDFSPAMAKTTTHLPDQYSDYDTMCYPSAAPTPLIMTTHTHHCTPKIAIQYAAMLEDTTTHYSTAYASTHLQYHHCFMPCYHNMKNTRKITIYYDDPQNCHSTNSAGNTT